MVFKARHVRAGHGVMEAQDGVGQSIAWAAPAQEVVVADDKAGLGEGGQRVLHRSLLAPECGGDRALRGLAEGDRCEDRVVEGPSAQRRLSDQQVDYKMQFV